MGILHHSTTSVLEGMFEFPLRQQKTKHQGQTEA